MHLDLPIDDGLIRQALQLTGLPTEKEVIEEALRLLIRSKKSRVSGQVQMSEDFDGRILVVKIDGHSGSRDQLEWLNEYQAKITKGSGILNDPNRLSSSNVTRFHSTTLDGWSVSLNL